MSKYYIEVKIQSSTHITYGDKPNKNNEMITSFMLKEGQVSYQNYQCNFVSQEISDSGYFEHIYDSENNLNLIYPFVNQNGEQIQLTQEQAIYEVYQLVNENQKSFQLKRNVMFNNCYVSFVEQLSGGWSFIITNKVNNIQIPMYAVVKKTVGLNGVYRLLKPTKQTYEIQKIYDLTILKNYYDNGGVYYDNLSFDYVRAMDQYIDLNTKQKFENCYNTSSTGNKKEYLPKKFYNSLEEANDVLKTIGYVDEPVCLAEKSYDGLILPVNTKPFLIRQPQWFYVEYTDIVNNQLVKTTAVQFWKNEEIPELYINKYYVSEGKKYLYPGYEHVSLTLKDVCPSTKGVNNEQDAWYYFKRNEITITNERQTFVIPVELEYEKDLSSYFSINYDHLQMTFEVVEGQLPEGLQFDQNGLLHGTCPMSSMGNYTFKVKATSFRCENTIVFYAVKVTNNQIFGITDKQFIFYNNVLSSFDLKQGLTQSPLQQDFIFEKGENFPTNVSLSQDGVLSANITSDYGFEFLNEEQEVIVDEETTEQVLSVKTISSASYDMNVKLIYSRYNISVNQNEYNFYCKYQSQSTFKIPIVYNILPVLEVENSIQGIVVAIEGNQIVIVSDAQNIIKQSFTIVLNKGMISQLSIIVNYVCQVNKITVDQQQFFINGYWLKGIAKLDLKEFVSNNDQEQMTFVLQEGSVMPNGITLENGVISGTFGTDIQENTDVYVIVSCANAFDEILRINFNVLEWYFEISNVEFNLSGIINQNMQLVISNVFYNKITEITKIVSSDYNIQYFIQENELKCYFNISEQITFDEIIEINGVRITLHYFVGEAVFLNIEQHLNNFVYYQYPLTSGATSVTSVSYNGFRECTDNLTYVGNVSGYPWRDISIKNNKLIFKVFRSNVSYSAKMHCELNTGEKFCLNVQVNDTAPFVELSYRLDYNGGCAMTMSNTNYHYHHRCSPISSEIVGEIKYTVLSKSDQDIICDVDQNGSLTMTTMKNDRKAYIGWVVFRVYNNGGHGDYLLSCWRGGGGGGDPYKNIQEGF